MLQGSGLQMSATIWKIGRSLGGHEGTLRFPPRVTNPLSGEWQRHVLASSGYLELGMFDDAAMVLEEIAPEDKTRNEVLGARVNLYMAARKWDMAAAVASHLVEVDPETAGWWISLAYALRRAESVEKAEAILLRAQAIHPQVAMIAFNLACLRASRGARGRRRNACAMRLNLIRIFASWRSTMKICDLCGIGSAVWNSLAGLQWGIQENSIDEIERQAIEVYQLFLARPLFEEDHEAYLGII